MDNIASTNNKYGTYGGVSGVPTGFRSEGSVKLTKEPTFGSLLSEIDGELERLCKLSQHLTDIGIKLFGNQPSECSNETPPPAEVSLLDSLSRRCTKLGKLLNECEYSARRIAEVL